MCRAWSHPTRQPPGRRVAWRIQCATNTRLRSLFPHFTISLKEPEKEWKYFWENFFFCFGSQKINVPTRRSAKTQSELKSRWPISSPSWCGWLFIINISCRSSCMFKGTLPHCTENAPPPSSAVREPPYPAIMPCQSHLNNPDNKTKAVNLWYWPGCERQGDAISKYQQRQIFCVRMIRNTAAAVTHWSGALRRRQQWSWAPIQKMGSMFVREEQREDVDARCGTLRQRHTQKAQLTSNSNIHEQYLTVVIFHIQAKYSPKSY